MAEALRFPIFILVSLVVFIAIVIFVTRQRPFREAPGPSEGATPIRE